MPHKQSVLSNPTEVYRQMRIKQEREANEWNENKLRQEIGDEAYFKYYAPKNKNNTKSVINQKHEVHNYNYQKQEMDTTQYQLELDEIENTILNKFKTHTNCQPINKKRR